MTTLVVARDGDRISIGCDGLSNAGGFVVSREIQKWILEGDCALGMAGEGVWQLEAERKHGFEHSPLLGGSPDPDELTDRLRERWMRVGLVPKADDDGGAPWRAWNGIYVCRQEVWYIDSSLGWTIQHGDWAQGSGRGYALGALFACKKRPAWKRILLALRAAQQYDANTGGVMRVWTLQTYGWDLAAEV